METRVQNAAPISSTGASCPRVRVLGTDVTAITFDAAGELLADLVRQRVGVYISPATVYSVTLAHLDPTYQRNINEAACVSADGMPIVWALKYFGYKAERVHHDDLFLACCERFPDWRHFLVGGRDGQPQLVAEELRRRYRGINVVGCHSTPTRPVPAGETIRIIEEIRAAQADVVWVGMGTPAQDYWMADAAPKTGVPMIGVGSAFDLLSGRTRPTPDWMKRSGLQWIFRLCQEPRRLVFRYLYYNTWFLLAFGWQVVVGESRRGA